METGIIFPQIIERGCGMDVHRDTVVATIMGKDIDQQTVTFSTFTNSLKELRVWLKQYGVTHIAMESTGVYWKPVFNILDGDFQILLVNANHIKNIPGHKTDKKDSVWIAKLLLSGLLKASFIPPRIIRDLRDLCRYRKNWFSRQHPNVIASRGYFRMPTLNSAKSSAIFLARPEQKSSMHFWKTETALKKSFRFATEGSSLKRMNWNRLFPARLQHTISLCSGLSG
ncbi:IS110 family transposase [Kaistella anthropi]|nr:IS110 family transposase [Kaistella anthropi]